MNPNTALVTGGNSGIGFECARQLARDGWHVVIASRNRDASAHAADQIRAEAGADSVSAMALDLGSLASVRAFISAVEQKDLPLRALVCNAGVPASGERKLSPDGFETTFAVNHLGHFLLTNLLLARLAAHAPARIVVVASGVHDPALTTGMPNPAIADLETLAQYGGPSEAGFDGRLAYVNSKLCNLWFVYELDRRLRAAGAHVTVNGYDPGLVPGSGLAREYPSALRFVWDHVLPPITGLLSSVVPMLSTAPRSGVALARLVSDPSFEDTSGKYFPSHSRWQEARSSVDSYDARRAAELWKLSMRLSGLPAGASLAAP